jgi:hypothetical protein
MEIKITVSWKETPCTKIPKVRTNPMPASIGHSKFCIVSEVSYKTAALP